MTAKPAPDSAKKETDKDKLLPDSTKDSNVSEAADKSPIEKTSDKPNEKPAKEATSSSNTGAILLAVFALILALGALGASFWLFKESQKNTVGTDDSQAELTSKIAANQAAIAKTKKDSETELKQQQKTIDSLPELVPTLILPHIGALKNELEQQKLAASTTDTRLSVLETRQNKTQGLLNNLPSQKVLWQLMEVVQLQRGALKRLQVDYDINAATQALQISINILKPLDIDDEGFLLAESKKTLRNLNNQDMVDIYAINEKLITAGKLLDGATLNISDSGFSMLKTLASEKTDGEMADTTVKNTTSSSAKPTVWYRNLWNDIMGEISKLIRYTPEERPLIPPGGDFFLKQSFSLSLLTLRSAVLRHDSRTFELEHTQLTSWIKKYIQASTRKKDLLNILDEISASLTEVNDKVLTALVSESEAHLSQLLQKSGER